ncbi:phosphotransferase [Kribbella sp. NPDC026596]|uniref:phosphotransferase family protein n=1 Tax=Kribbella sp. NPDC026596 TaxID=3155122 RepID=UPI0033E1BB0A
MSGAPDVDYTATSLRPDWDTLPPALHESLAVALGTEITAAAPPVASGFTGGFAAPVRLADGRRVFVKAADDSMHAYHAYQREAEVVPQLPSAIRVPQIISTAHAVAQGGAAASSPPRWFAVVSEWVEGRMPGRPWTGEDFELVTATCERIAEVMDPSPFDGLKLFLDELVEGESPLQVPEQIIAGDRPLPRGLQPWVRRILPELADLVQLAPEAFAGNAASHGDLRPDNLIIDADRTCWTVDWNWLALGPRWLDWVGLLPIAQHHGIDTAAAIRSSPLTADVPADHLDCYNAVVAAYMLRNADAPPPPGCTPALREHQRLYAWTFLDWLAARRGW